MALGCVTANTSKPRKGSLHRGLARVLDARSGIHGEHQFGKSESQLVGDDADASSRSDCPFMAKNAVTAATGAITMVEDLSHIRLKKKGKTKKKMQNI